MALEKIEILGYRGFTEAQTAEFAIPNNKELSSGLTIITGANNSGKSSIIECLKARGGNQPVSFTVGKRNPVTDHVKIVYTVNGNKEVLSSVEKGSSETKTQEIDKLFRVFVVPSRRAFQAYFHRSIQTRMQYLDGAILPPQRNPILENFQNRLFKILENKDAFNKVLYKILPEKLDWTIDQSDQGQFFLKFYNGKNSHSSDGLGEGIVSIFSIVDSLYDSSPGEVIVIDEPELSLHPTLQKRLFSVFREFSIDRQLIISTHSPYFVDMKSLINGAKLLRVVNEGQGTKIYQLTERGREILKKLAEGNLHNPHTFGLDAKELFFQDDGIIIVEGQEDVLLFPDIAEQLNKTISASFFGWGAGGASNIRFLCELFHMLGFKKVAAVLDGNKVAEVQKLKKEFATYHFDQICANDVRTKAGSKAIVPVIGLLDETRKIRSEYIDNTKKILDNLNIYMEEKIL